MMTLTHYGLSFLECDVCGHPIAQGARYIIDGPVARHPVCPPGEPRPPAARNLDDAKRGA